MNFASGKNKSKGKFALMAIMVLLIGSLGGKMLFAEHSGNGMDFALRRGVLWYEQPWLWVAAACFFIFLMVMLVKRNEQQ